MLAFQEAMEDPHELLRTTAEEQRLPRQIRDQIQEEQRLLLHGVRHRLAQREMSILEEEEPQRDQKVVIKQQVVHQQVQDVAHRLQLDRHKVLHTNHPLLRQLEVERRLDLRTQIRLLDHTRGQVKLHDRTIQ